MVELEPVKYQKRTNIGEHNQIVDKVNEIITVMNDSDLEGMTGITDRVDTLETEMETVNADVTELTTDLGLANNAIDDLDARVDTVQTDITGLDTRLDTVESDIQGIDTEITGLNEHIVNSVGVSKGAATGQISVSVGFESAEPVSGSGSVNLSDVAKASTLAFTPSADGVAISLGVVEGSPKSTNLPVASTTQAGVLKASDYAKIGEPYELPIASADTLGGIKVGANLSITPEGVLSASGGGGGAGEITSVVVESSDLGLTVGVNGVNSDPEPVRYLDAETMVVGTESPPASGNLVSGITMGGGFGNDIVIGANVPSVGGSPTLRISGGDYDAITRVDILNVDGLEVKNNSDRLAVGGSNLALASEIPDTSGFLTKTEADSKYQPKGSYLTSVPVAGTSIGGVKNGGNVVVDGSGNMNVTIPDVSGFITETEADSKYQPKGSYLTSVPIGGASIGGVKNGGNVTINADGTMNALGGSEIEFRIFNDTNELETILNEDYTNPNLYRTIILTGTVTGELGTEYSFSGSLLIDIKRNYQSILMECYPISAVITGTIYKISLSLEKRASTGYSARTVSTLPSGYIVKWRGIIRYYRTE